MRAVDRSGRRGTVSTRGGAAVLGQPFDDDQAGPALAAHRPSGHLLIDDRRRRASEVHDQRRHGLAGGRAGARGSNFVRRKNGRVDELAGNDETDVMPGDSFVMETPGGAAYPRVMTLQTVVYSCARIEFSVLQGTAWRWSGQRSDLTN